MNSLNGDVKSIWQKLRSTSAIDSETIADTALLLDKRPDGTCSFGSNLESVIKLCGYATGVSANSTFTVKLWGFRNGSTLAEYIATVTLTVGTSAITADPVTGDKVTGMLIDTCTIANDNWSLPDTPLIIEGADSAHNRLGCIHLDLVGLHYVYAERTAGAGSLVLFYSYLND